MHDTLIAINWALPLAYLALVVDYGAAFSLRLRTRPRVAWLVLLVAVHTGYLVLQGFEGGRRLVTDPYAIPSILAVSMTAVYVLIEVATRDRRTGVFVLGLAFLFQYTSSMIFPQRLAEAAAAGPETASTWHELHVVPAALSYTALAFAGIYGLLCTLVQRGLKRHRFGVLFDRLPPLETLGRMTWLAVVIGFVFMTLALASAPLLMHAERQAGAAAEISPKVLAKIITGIVAWGIYAVAVAGRLLGKWAPARVARVAVAGFVVVLVLLVASGLLS